MDHKVPKHEKIRFRRHEITDLSAFPSAEGQDFGKPRQNIARRCGRLALAAGAVLATVLAVLAAIVFAIGYSGMGSERLRAEAEKAIETFAGVDVTASMGPAGVSVDGSRLVALEVRDVSVKAADGAPIIDAGLVRFGVRFLPLLSGNIRLGSAGISDARITTAAMPMADRGDWTKILKNDDGLINPDKVAEAIFGQVSRALDALEVGSTRQIQLENVEFVLPEDGRVRIVRIAEASLSEAGPGELTFTADIDIDGRGLALTGTATRDTVSHRITDLNAQVKTAALAQETPALENGSDIGDFSLTIAGQQGIATNPSQLTASLSLDRAVLDLGKDGAFNGAVNVQATLLTGSNKIEIDRLRVATGRSNLEFNGAIGPRPATGLGGDKPLYRYELVSTAATLAPQDSPEPALDLIARVNGTFDAEKNLITADQIAVKSGSGEVVGTASLEIPGGGKAPGIALALAVHDMDVSHVKQIWPLFAAKGARSWVLDHVFGGRVLDGRLQFKVAPDRLGNGIPLTADEVSGRFQIDDTRFDTAGLIPPVRDAMGVVDFQGNDVDISLSSGTVFLPSGRSVIATDGKLRIEKANRPPLIGSLDINVAGEAAAITELASYDPINAMRFVGMKPDEFSGKVSGNVKADIPLSKGIDTSKLFWHVALDYEDLSLARPLDGQRISDADGTIVVEPDNAVITAKAKLNGIPADISIIEPLRAGGPERQRKVQLVLDDATRESVMPELSTLVTGTIKVNLDAKTAGSQAVTADLTNAKLDIPWVGWSKGPGIAADLSFTLQKSEGNSTLSDFRLEGKSFAIGGSIALAGGSFSSARLTTVKLNRDDNVAVSIKRSGKSYSVDVSGSQMDARSLIKQFTSDVGSSPAGKAGGGAGVSVNLDVRAITGFGGEQLSNVAVSYSGAGSKVNGLKVSAVTGSGSAVTVRSSSDGGQRSLQMQSADAGAILRFMNIYDNMQGGAIKLALAAAGDGPMSGQVDTSNFWIVNEPRLASIVSTTPPGDERSLNQAVKSNIDTSRVQFERGFAQIEKGQGYLKIGNGVLRGPLIGTTFQGTLYDERGNMAMTGTFMPAYGLNRIFGEIPLFGAILGNGRDRGLIGVTYRLSGNAKSPNMQINPLSVIAPGIFRSIFEFQ
ncbi:DUF3971 domain-containing protein [Mesorhizobium sp. CGMCC 1.15528]|uniref:DUF3971 domain-containing protein n=1 Tax=Mesorhizobium zhangyense TaxID=1776730 RepID=A0A7C9R490_9HYPH|nr:DUF3971 domain-containing protein [Mesorhizobium zhangyense]NGN39614.1 DUF3971 domain-containing protein [Mesorhizobium zhangyense]